MRNTEILCFFSLELIVIKMWLFIAMFLCYTISWQQNAKKQHCSFLEKLLNQTFFISVITGEVYEFWRGWILESEWQEMVQKQVAILIRILIKSFISTLKYEIKSDDAKTFRKHPTMMELEMKSSLFSSASGHETQTARQLSVSHRTFHSVSRKSSTKASCVQGSGPLNDGPLSCRHANIPDWRSIREIQTNARWSFISAAPVCSTGQLQYAEGLLSGTR